MPTAVPDRALGVKDNMATRVSDLNELDPLRKTASKQSLDELDNEYAFKPKVTT